MSEQIENVIIIGSGPAGHTAAIYTARAELKPLMIEGLQAGGQPGGQLMLTTEVENFPGFPEGITGPAMMSEFKKQSERFGTRIISDDVVEVDFSSSPYMVKTSRGETYKGKTVIIATGAQAKWLGIPGEEEYQSKGVSACATCDGFFFKEKRIVLVGGGDSAMEEAIFLTRFATKVTVLVRRDELRASKIMQKRAMENEKIEFMWNTEAREVIGDGTKVTAIKVENNKTGEITEVETDGFFLAIGHTPNTGLFKEYLDLDETGYLVIKPGSTKTKIEGVFAAGDVADHYYRQAITAAGTGCMAALDAERYLAAHDD